MRTIHPWYRRAFAAVGVATGLLPKPDPHLAMDGWENQVTGLGTYGRDKAMHAHFEAQSPLALDWTLLDSIYHNDDISGRIIDIPVDHMFRKGWTLHVAEDTDKSQAKGFTKYAKKLQLKKRFKQATTWGRLKGGALGVMVIDDNLTIDKPVNEAAIRSIKAINVVERQYVFPHSVYTDPFHPKCGEPESYLVVNSQVGSMNGPANLAPGRMTYVVHETRTVRFEGANTSKLERLRLAGWTHSVLQRPYEKIKAFAQAFQAAGNIMTDASQGVYKLEGLMSQIAGREKDMLETRMMMMDMGRSVARSVILDKDGEEFERTIAAITGYPDMLDRFMMLLSAATDCCIPVTLLMGRSAAGMNSTGDSDFRQFYDAVEGKQTDDLEPNLQRAYRYIGLAQDGPTGGKEVELEFKFRSLWSPTIMEHAQINQIQSAADLNNVTAGIYTGEEIALSRSGDDDGEINLFTKIDIKGRQDAQNAAEQFKPYDGEDDPEKGATGGEMDLKRQGAIAPAPPPPGPPGQAMTGRGSKTTSPNSTQPGAKSGSGK